jgi:hypothetical protein
VEVFDPASTRVEYNIKTDVRYCLRVPEDGKHDDCRRAHVQYVSWVDVGHKRCFLLVLRTVTSPVDVAPSAAVSAVQQLLISSVCVGWLI